MTSSSSPSPSVKAPEARFTPAAPLDTAKVLEAKFSKFDRILNAEFERPLCDDCLEEQQPSGHSREAPAGDVYCRNCRQMLCDSCCLYHRKAKACRSHVLVAFEKSHPNCDFSVDGKAPGVCRRHADKQQQQQHLLNCFCFDCKDVVCKICLEEFHSKHKCADVTDVCDRFRKEILDHLTLCLSSEKTVSEKGERLRHEQNENEALIDRLKAEIDRTREEMKRLVDNEADRLLQEVHLLQVKRNTEIEASVTRVVCHLSQVDSFKNYARKITSQGSVSDVCQSVTDLKVVSNVLENETKEIAESELRLFPISFTSGHFEELMEKDANNVFGKIEGKLAYTMDPVLLSGPSPSPPSNLKFISGIALLNSQIFTTRYSTSEIGVYDSSFAFSRAMRVTKVLRDPHCIVSCPLNDCLYIVNRTERESTVSDIVRISPSGILLNRWAVDDNSYGRISVTDKGTVIKTFHLTSHLVEYTCDGQVVRDIALPGSVERPWHAMQTPGGEFVVSHGQYGDKQHRVCLVDCKGQLKTSFSMDASLDTKYLNCPVHLSLCSDGTVVCVDANNRRLLMLSSTLHFQRELLSRVDGIESRPHAVCVDEAHQRLLVSVKDTFVAFQLSGVEGDAKKHQPTVNRSISSALN